MGICLIIEFVVCLQLAQIVATFYDLLHDEGTEPLGVDNTATAIERTLVALGPFHDVAIGAYGGKVASGHKPCGESVGNDIGERQMTGVGVRLYLTHAHRERGDVGWHEDMRTTGSLGATLEGAIVNGAH